MQSDSEPKSKSRKKRDSHQLQQLGERLLALSPEQLDALALPNELSEAVRFANTLKKHGAIRRQKQYIGALMRGVDPDPIREALNQLDQAKDKEVRTFQLAERWRNELIHGGDERFSEFITQFPGTDAQHLRQLIRNAKKETDTRPSKKSSKALFRYLMEIMKT